MQPNSKASDRPTPLLRADRLLLQRGLADSRAQAQRLIDAGVRWCAGEQWNRVLRNSEALPLDAQLDLSLADAAGALRYVSRGGLKLESALRQARLDVAGARCLDLGQSTGGFSDCLLQHGAARVVGVDVGHGQLAPSLRADARIVCIERVNARDALALRAALLGETDFDLIVGDLSFISQTLVLPAARPLLRAGGQMLLLVKPQFELQPGQIGKGGVVRSASLHEQARQRVLACCESLGLVLQGWFDSPIRGGDGNREFFVQVSAPAFGR